MNNYYDEIKKYYSIWWENTNDPRYYIFQKLNKLVRKRIPSGIGRKKALDIGSGKGTIVSFLREKGYEVTAVELNEDFVRNLKEKFPDVKVIEGDFNFVLIDDFYELVTAIEVVQNFNKESLEKFIEKISLLTSNLFINISNKHSFHGIWVRVRNFKKNFVYMYTPSEIEELLEKYGFEIVYRKGIGFITPVTLFSEFRIKIIPIWFAKLINFFFDNLFPKCCHLYYIEAKRKY